MLHAGQAAGLNQRQCCLAASAAMTDTLIYPLLYMMYYISSEEWQANVHGSLKGGCSQPNC